MKKIAILADSGCQIPIGSLEKDGVFIVPLNIIIGDKSYLDNVEITSEQVFNLIDKENVIAKTAQPSTGIIEEAALKIKSLGYDHILALPIGSGLSSTIEGMKIACDMAEMPITSVDTRCAPARAQAYLVETASSLVKEGKELDEIVDILEDMIKNSGTLIIVPNLNHLKRSGRLTPSVALLANMLKIVPIMQLSYDLGGKIDSLDKVRTVKKANLRAIDYLIEECHINNTDYELVIEHVLADEIAYEMKDVLISKIGPCDIVLRELPATVGAHMGKGGIGYQFVKKYKG